MGLTHATRWLVAHEELNVTRDVLDFEFMKNSNLPDEEFEYDLYIKEWESTHMILYCNFTNPTSVSNGLVFDQAKLKVHKHFLFVSADSGKILEEDKTNLQGEFPKQYLPGIDVKTIL